MRGAQGAGKSTFLSQQGLDGFVLSPDALRLQMGGVIMQPDGRFAVSSFHDKKVWEEMERLMAQKMARGEFIIVDATYQNARDFKTPLKLAQRHGYKVWCVDFSHVPADVAKARNVLRPAYKQVPEDVIDRAYERFAASRVPEGIAVLRPEDFAGKPLTSVMALPLVDLNAYERVHHIGDVQGCHAPVSDYFRDGLREDEFYIFVGDFLDRGIQNGEVIRFVIDALLPRGNVALIYGNHEYHIERFAHDLPPVSGEFEHKTLPQILAANFTRGEAHHLLARLQDALTYTYGPYKVLVTHAGVARVPDDFALMPSMQFWKGTGTYDDPVDVVFSRNMAGTEWLQVHGHRNSKKLPIHAAPQSFNLESEVEFGGPLSVMTLTREGTVATVGVPNTVFAAPKAAKTMADARCVIAPATLEALKAHDAVQEKRFASHPHIRSYNFTRTAFHKGVWDSVSLKARGLFVDDRGEIVARAYDKFFNLEERPETQMRNLQSTLAFPLTLYVKENGFLGLLGYDGQNDALFFASKSTPESEFCGWFRDIVTRQVGEVKLGALKTRLRDEGLALVFEVNDPVRDPHMIEYETPHVVLLDAVRRQDAFGRLDFDAMTALAADLGVAAKRTGLVFTNWPAFAAWYAGVEAAGLDYRFDGRHIEGFVVEDAVGFMFKIKLPFYAFWKQMRALKERILAARQMGTEARTGTILNLTGAAGQAFNAWALTQSDEVLALDIIALRKLYLATAAVEA
jgi:predicted kinase